MGILAAAKRFPGAVVAGFSAVFRGVGRATKPSEVTMQRCQSCGEMRMTKFVAFYRNVGMLFRRQTYTIMGNLCMTCVHKQFWKFESLDVVLGPWGMLSAIVAPIYFVQNIFSYVAALYKLSGAENPDSPPSASKSPLPTIAILIGVVALLLLGVRAIMKQPTKEKTAVMVHTDPPKAQPVAADIPLSDKDAAVACGAVLKLDKAGFAKLDLIARINQLITESGVTDEELKELSSKDEFQQQVFSAYGLAYLSWDKSAQYSKADLDKDITNVVNSVDTRSLSSDEKTQIDEYLAKLKNAMVKAFELGRRDAKMTPCPY
jgi:hypothetical protein